MAADIDDRTTRLQLDNGANTVLISEGDEYLFKKLRMLEETRQSISGIGSAELTSQCFLGGIRAYTYGGDKSVISPDIIGEMIGAEVIKHNRVSGTVHATQITKKTPYMENRPDGESWNADLLLGLKRNNGLYYCIHDIVDWIAGWDTPSK